MNSENELKIVSKYIGKSSIYFIVGYPLSMIAGILIAKKVGAENLGLISLYLSFMQVLSFISVFGTDRGSIKYISKFLGLEKHNDIKKVILFSFVFPLFTMTLILAIYLIFGKNLLFFNSPDLTKILKVFIFCLPVFVYKQSLMGVLRGLQRPHIDRFNQSIIYPLSRVILLFIFVLFFGLFYSLLFATVLSIIFGVFFMIYNLNKELKTRKIVISNESSDLKIKEYLFFSLPLVLIPVINVAVSNIDTLLISQYLESKSIGVYTMVKRFGLLISIPLSIASPMIASSVSKMFSQNKMNDFKPIYIFITKWSVFTASVLFCIIFVYSKQILQFIGDEFIIGDIPLKIFAFSQLLIVLIGPIGNVLIMGDRKNLFIIYSYISVIIGFIAIFQLTPNLGIVGSIISISLIFVILNLLCLITLISKFKIYPMTLSQLTCRACVVIFSILAHQSIFSQNDLLLKENILSMIFGSIFIFGVILLYYFFIERPSKEDKFIIAKLKNFLKK